MNLGERVRLKSGGPEMTVTAVDPPFLECSWFAGTERYTTKIDQEAVERADEPDRDRALVVAQKVSEAGGAGLLRDGFKMRLLDTADGHLVRRSDFYFEGDTIRCRPVPTAQFEVTERSDMDGRWIAVTMQPGTFREVEDTRVADNMDIVRLFEGWREALEEELSVAPAVRRVRELEAMVEELRELFVDGDDADTPFTREEVVGLRARLDQLQVELDRRVKENADLREEVDRAHKDIEGLKVMLDTLSRKTWLETALPRLAPWVKSGITGAKALLELAHSVKGLLGDGSGGDGGGS